MFIEFNENYIQLFDEFKVEIDKGKIRLENLIKQDKHTYRSFIEELELADSKLELIFTQISHINSTYNNKKLDKIYLEAVNIFTDYSNIFYQNSKVYNIVKYINDNDSDINSEKKRVLQNYLMDFKLGGIALSKDKRDRFNEIKKKLNQLSLKFSQNVLKDTNSFSLKLTSKELRGIKKSILEPFKNKQGGYTFNLQAPSYITVMTHVKDRSIREKLYFAYQNRGKNNSSLITEILKLKKERAEILGYKNQAEYSLATKMAKDCKDVTSFLYKLAKRSKAQAEKELNIIKDEAKKDGLRELKSYDLTYYSNIIKDKKYSLNEEKYREYFELNQTLKNIFKFIAEQFDLEIFESKKTNKDTRTFYIVENGQIISKLYLDLEVRKNKNSGAWMHDFETRYKDSKGIVHPSSAFVVCNFPKSSKKHKSLLRVDDVTTLLHELGHALHHIMSKVDTKGASGIGHFEWDAVEFPSQFLENFFYEFDVLKQISQHYKSDKSLPDNMIKNLIKTKNYNSALMMLRQIEFSLFDFLIHLDDTIDVAEVLHEVQNKVAVIKSPLGTNFQNSFTHIFSGGYSAGYYSYKWAEVLSADAYVYIDKLGRKDGLKRYKEEVLYAGNSKKAEDIYHSFKNGQKIDTNNLLILSGIN